jgi:hypothetical protein
LRTFEELRPDLIVALEDYRLTAQRSHALVADAWARTRALQLQIASGWHQLAASRQVLKRTTAMADSQLGGMAPSSPQMSDESATTAGIRTFAAVTELIEQVERIAQGESDAMDRLITDIKATILGDGEPYMLMGVLMEGIVQTLAQRLPASQRRETVLALFGLMCDRLNLDSLGLT